MSTTLAHSLSHKPIKDKERDKNGVYICEHALCLHVYNLVYVYRYVH